MGHFWYSENRLSPAPDSHRPVSSHHFSLAYLRFSSVVVDASGKISLISAEVNKASLQIEVISFLVLTDFQVGSEGNKNEEDFNGGGNGALPGRLATCPLQLSEQSCCVVSVPYTTY